MQLVIFVSNQNFSDFLLNKLKNFFNDFKLINIDDPLNVFDLQKYFLNRKIYVLDLCNTVKSHELITFLVSSSSITCFDLKFLFRSYFHFKYSGKFFDLLDLKNVKKITSHEIMIYNRSVEHTIELLNGFPIIFKSYDDQDEKLVAIDRKSFDLFYSQFFELDSGFYLSQNHNEDDFLECVFKDKKLLYVYNANKIILESNLDKDILNSLNVLSKQLPVGVITFKMVKTQNEYFISSFNFGINTLFIEIADLNDFRKIINLESL